MSDDPSTHTGGRDAATPPAMPRWVKYLLLALAALLVLAVVVMLISGGNHGPGRHAATTVGESSATQQWR